MAHSEPSSHYGELKRTRLQWRFLARGSTTAINKGTMKDLLRTEGYPIRSGRTADVSSIPYLAAVGALLWKNLYGHSQKSN